MKSKVYRLLICIFGIAWLSLSSISCDSPTDSYKQFAGKKEISYSQKVDTVIAKAGINSVVLKLPKPVNPLVKKARVFWNLDHDSVEAKFLPDKDTLRIDIDTLNVSGIKRNYVFNVYTYTEAGNRSVGVQKTIDIYGKDAAPGNFTNIEVKNTLGGAQINYTLFNTDNLKNVKAVYRTKPDSAKIVKTNTSRSDSSFIIDEFDDAQTHNLKIYATSTSGFQSKPKTVIIHPYISFDQTNWNVISVDSYNKNPAFPGSNAIDGDKSTFWQTMQAPNQPSLPHSITIDMEKINTIHGITIIGRLDQADGNPNDIDVQVSNDTTSWGVSQNFTLEYNNDKRTDIDLSPDMKGRYMKLTVNGTINNTFFTNVAEIYTFGR